MLFIHRSKWIGDEHRHGRSWLDIFSNKKNQENEGLEDAYIITVKGIVNHVNEIAAVSLKIPNKRELSFKLLIP